MRPTSQNGLVRRLDTAYRLFILANKKAAKDLLAAFFILETTISF
ncbi:MAG: hypothetical protein Q8Q55_01235 [Undibacterium sp.]|nr:hypothetical protein [Undibacterium sp.]